MLQTVNLSDRVKVSPFFMLFFNHFKILIIATSAFLKHQFIKLFIRSIAIFVILILLLFLVFFLLPCNLLGFNWLLATLVIVAAWVSPSFTSARLLYDPLCRWNKGGCSGSANGSRSGSSAYSLSSH